MKKAILFLTLIICFTSCKKNDEYIPTMTDYIGEWHGTSTEIFIDKIYIDTIAYRQISQIYPDRLNSTWCFVPKIWTFMYFDNNMYSIQAILKDSTICNNKMHRWIYVYSGKGTLQYDGSLIEKGKIEKWYYIDNKLLVNDNGTWHAELTKFTSGRILQ